MGWQVGRKLFILFFILQIRNQFHFPVPGDDSKREPLLTKAQLYKYYSGRGPTELFAEFMMQPELRQHASIITRVSAPLEDKYHKDLEAQTQGPETMLAWATRRAQGTSWWSSAKQILAQVFHPDLISDLGLTMPLKPALEQDLGTAWMVASWLQFIV